MFQKVSRIEKIYAYEGNITIFVEILLSHSTNKVRKGTLLSFTKPLVSKNLINGRGGGVTIFRQNCFSSQYLIFP